MEPCLKEAELATIETQIKTIFKRMDEQMELSKAVYELVSEVKVMNLKLQQMSEGQDHLKEDVDELKSKAGKTWDSITKTAITALVSGGIAYVLFRLGLRS